jgi:hypothetical protein
VCYFFIITRKKKTTAFSLCIRTHINLVTLIFFSFFAFLSVAVSLDHRHFCLRAFGDIQNCSGKALVCARLDRISNTICLSHMWLICLSLHLAVPLVFLFVSPSNVTRSLHQSLFFFSRETCRLML